MKTERTKQNSEGKDVQASHIAALLDYKEFLKITRGGTKLRIFFRLFIP